MQRGDDEWERRFVLIVSPAIIFVCRFTAAATTPLHAAMQDILRQPSSASQPVLSACKPVRIITMKAVEQCAGPCAAAVIITPIQSHFSNNASDFELLGVCVQAQPAVLQAVSVALNTCLDSTSFCSL